MTKTSFSIILHNHQPCDNFGWVFEDAYKKSYEPFIDVLEKYPQVKVTMHYSGSLLEWLSNNKPRFIARVKTLVQKRQVELLTGGFYEPILPIIPDRDKMGQINLLTGFIKNYFEYMAKGAWIAERVWETNLSDTFLKLGINYSIVDENHLKRAGISRSEMYKYYELKNKFKVFVADKKLRYIIPFAGMKDVSEYFKKVSSKKGNSCMVFADDGEKFGFWPHTYDWVYKKKWLESFFEFLSDKNAPVETMNLSEVINKSPAGGEVDIPPSSYSEMMEWAKGDFNNFFKIYPEANIMRNRMLYVSDIVDEAASRSLSTSKQKNVLDEARKELYRAQSGCAYWHGIFGGLYLNHLRSGIYKHLINAQRLVEELSVGRKISIKKYDLDNDSKEEVIIGNKFIDLYIKPDNRGAVFELDDKIKSHNMINTVRRQPEVYHSKLLKRAKPALRNMKKEIDEDKYVNIHDILGVKGRRLKRFLVYDNSQKSAFMDYVILNKPAIKDFAKADYKHLLEISKKPYRIQKTVNKDSISFVLEKEETLELGTEEFPLYIKKEIKLAQGPEFSVEYTLKNLSGERLRTIFATEFNWSVMNRSFLKNRDFKRLDSLVLKDEWTEVEVKHSFSEKIRLWVVPVYTLNESEAGLGKTYQYLSLLVQRPLELGENEITKFNSRISVN